MDKERKMLNKKIDALMKDSETAMSSKLACQKKITKLLLKGYISGHNSVVQLRSRIGGSDRDLKIFDAAIKEAQDKLGALNKNE